MIADRLAPASGVAAFCLALAILAAPAIASAEATPGGAQPGSGVEVTGKTVSDLARDLAAGRLTAVALVNAYRARIAADDRAGPRIGAVIALDPGALEAAAASDARRRRGEPARPLEGIPLLVKDNIETKGPLPTTAGSLALAGNVALRDAPLVARLRAAGAIILGKTNLSEWANSRSSFSISGWSAVGGLTRNPYALDRSACGSSSGSAAAVAASFAPVAIGTETDGSITCPAAMQGLVGLKPTVGLVSRAGVIPISHTQDTPGPIARDVADAALVARVIAGPDAADPATAAADRHILGVPGAHALRGARIGVLRFLANYDDREQAIFAHALGLLRGAGATLVEITDGPDMDAIGHAENIVMLTEFKAGLDAYLAATPPPVGVRSLAALIAFNRAHAASELALFGQDVLLKTEAAKGLADPAYLAAKADAARRAGRDGIDRLLASQHLDALVAPTTAPAWSIDAIDGDHDPGSASSLPAVAGYPHLTVPMGTIDGLPVGLSFIGPAWSETRLLGLGADFERASGLHLLPSFAPTARLDPAQRASLSPR